MNVFEEGKKDNLWDSWYEATELTKSKIHKLVFYWHVQTKHFGLHLLEEWLIPKEQD